MPQTLDVINNYESGEQSAQKGDFLSAARYYRDCYYSFEFGEFSIYPDIVYKYGTSAGRKYDDCLKKLPKGTREQLEEEEQELYGTIQWC